MELVIVAAAAVALILLVNAHLDAPAARRAMPVLLAAFAARLAVHVLVVRSGLIEYGGDNLGYEVRGLMILNSWKLDGFRFVTAADMEILGTAAVPCNIFALVMFVCGGYAPLACTAVVALLACGLCVVMYRIARLIGADDRAAYRLLLVTAFTPAFLLHTSDTYKDGFNAFLVVACVGIGASLAQRFRTSMLALAAPLLWCLWHVRPYMVFMAVIPIVCGVVASKSAFSVRKLFAFGALLMVAMLFAGGVYENTPLELAERQMDQGQSEAVMRSNAENASGVHFDDGGDRWSGLGMKVVYTLLSPFPWQSGSLTLHLGKIDVVIWYILLYGAIRGGRELWRRDRRTLLIFLLFLLPGTIAYATTMANIGLIFRQRLPIVLVASLLAAVAWTRSAQDRSPAPPVEPEEREALETAGGSRKPPAG
ncbi:hypothetical protein GCM10010149_05060 [Nonomuraea roseoviolacea subsp. roseoviolacea]|uniref:hypothetical protein n=1 Tax=Nonomuraea roseoviolacea TaxID=103837 RepID=UPI0031D9755D